MHLNLWTKTVRAEIVNVPDKGGSGVVGPTAPLAVLDEDLSRVRTGPQEFLIIGFFKIIFNRVSTNKILAIKEFYVLFKKKVYISIIAEPAYKINTKKNTYIYYKINYITYLLF